MQTFSRADMLRLTKAGCAFCRAEHGERIDCYARLANTSDVPIPMRNVTDEPALWHRAMFRVPDIPRASNRADNARDQRRV